MTEKPNKFYKKRSVVGYLGVTLRGLLMGGADVIPGVSGGTMALILGIYRELIASIKAIDLTALKLLFTGKFREFSEHINLPFLLALLFGIATAIISLAKIIPSLLYNYPYWTKGFFFGLIGASIFFVWKQIRRHDLISIALLFISAVGAYTLVGIMPFHTPETLPFIFFSGFIAICAMILPGISGAFILLILGKYSFILESLSKVIHERAFDHNLLVVLVFILGCAAGLLSFARFLNWLFQKYPDYTLAALAGLMLGSLRKIWPFQRPTESLSQNLQLLDEYLWPFPQLLQQLREYIYKKNLFFENYWPSNWEKTHLITLALVVIGFITVLSINYLAERKAPAKESPQK